MLGWNDGKIRTFLPQSEKLLFAINYSHNHGITSIAGMNDGLKIVSGGMKGEKRIWRSGRQTHIVEGSLKEHIGIVSDIKITKERHLSCFMFIQ